jgi:hypothetical protein
MWLAVVMVPIGGLIAYTVLPVWRDWRREAPLRREIKAKQVTFRIELSRVRRQECPGDDHPAEPGSGPAHHPVLDRGDGPA